MVIDSDVKGVIFMKPKTCNNCSKKKNKDEKKDCAKQHSIHDPSKQGCIAWKGDKKNEQSRNCGGRN